MKFNCFVGLPNSCRSPVPIDTFLLEKEGFSFSNVVFALVTDPGFPPLEEARDYCTKLSLFLNIKTNERILTIFYVLLGRGD